MPPLQPLSDPAQCAVILAGAGTKGAFEAGALSLLLQAGHRFGSVVGASSGALNGALLAAATRAGAEEQAAAVLGQGWVDHAGFWDVFSPSLLGILSRSGFSTDDKLLEQLERTTAPWLPGQRRPVRLVIVVTALNGKIVEVGGVPATTFENPLSFTGSDFDTAESRSAIFRATAASGAIPVVFVPVDVPGVGRCADGGLVNNTPIKYALADPAVRRVFVIVPYPSPLDPPPPARGLDLIVHAIDIFIQERLLRDLKEAVQVNRQLESLRRLAQSDAALAQQVGAEMGLLDKRPVEIVQIRPPQTLAGTDLSGFNDKSLRAAQVEAGRAAAGGALERAPTVL
jgi:NTE family protein